MNYCKYIFALWIIFSVSSCNRLNKEIGDKKIDVTIMQLNDVYEIAPLSGGKEAGMARVETIHKQLLQENPNTFLVLAGDFLSPSLFNNIEYQGDKVKGKQMIEVLNAMKFDLVTFGNHEFDLKEKELQKRLNESTFPWTIANVKHKIDSLTGPFYTEKSSIKMMIPETYILNAKDTDGTLLKIGVFSVCVPDNQPEYTQFSDVFKSAKKAYEQLRPNCDFVVGLTHLPVEQDKKLAELLPDVPLIMGGHEHNNILVPVGNTQITKADANARTVYIHRISFNKRTKKATINSTLKKIDDTIKSDPEIDKIVSKWQVILNDKVKQIVSDPNEVIYTTTKPLEAREIPIRSGQTNMGSIIAKAMIDATKADCALLNSGSVRIDDQLTGDLTAVDIFRTLPYGGAIFTIKIKGDFLKKILDYGVEHKGKGAYLQRAGILFDEANKQWIIGTKPLKEDKKYEVAITDFLLTGYDIPFLNYDNKEVLKVKEPNPKNDAFDIRKSVIKYLKNLN